MRKPLSLGAILILTASISLTLGVHITFAQGPAGNGAVAAQDHSLNPLKWTHKDSASTANSPATRADLEKRLTPALQSQGLLPADSSASDACSPFPTLDSCLAALHASHNLSLNFNCLRADVTGVHTNADLSGCKVADGEKTESLKSAIHHLKPDANAHQSAKDAEQQAKSDLNSAGA